MFLKTARHVRNDLFIWQPLPKGSCQPSKEKPTDEEIAEKLRKDARRRKRRRLKKAIAPQPIARQRIDGRLHPPQSEGRERRIVESNPVNHGMSTLREDLRKVRRKRKFG